jgi:hypothetical protein
MMQPNKQKKLGRMKMKIQFVSLGPYASFLLNFFAEVKNISCEFASGLEVLDPSRNSDLHVQVKRSNLD